MRYVVLLLAIACARVHPNERLITTYQSVNAARDSLSWMDHEVERQWKESAEPSAAIRSAIEGYRQRRVFVVEAFANAYAAIAAAAFDESQIPLAATQLKYLRDELKRLRTGEGR